jgi:hypothetical protein
MTAAAGNLRERIRTNSAAGVTDNGSMVNGIARQGGNVTVDSSWSGSISGPRVYVCGQRWGYVCNQRWAYVNVGVMFAVNVGHLFAVIRINLLGTVILSAAQRAV